MELGNATRGQFFKPYEVSFMITKMTVGDGKDLRKEIEQRGFSTMHEPACGAGGMVIACAQALRDKGINYQQHLHVTAIDIDPRPPAHASPPPPSTVPQEGPCSLIRFPRCG